MAPCYRMGTVAASPLRLAMIVGCVMIGYIGYMVLADKGGGAYLFFRTKILAKQEGECP